jgi:hypothetical protein
MLKRAWHKWTRIARKVGTFQARVLLTIFYGVIVLPFGVFARVASDTLRIKHRPTQWLDSPTQTHDLPWARRQ